MNKTATTDLLRLALQSLLVGGGAYSGARLMHDIPNQLDGRPQKSKNELELTLPAARIPKVGSVSDYVLPAVTGIGGVGAGFLGASTIYDHIKKKQMESEMQEAQKNYMAALQQAHQKTAAVATPLTDKFLKGMISKVGELANKEGWNNINIPTESPLDTASDATWAGVRGLGHTQIGSALQAAAMLATLGTGAGVYYLHDQADKQKEKNKQTTTLPTDIKLNVG